jgi:hypothetical protein
MTGSAMNRNPAKQSPDPGFAQNARPGMTAVMAPRKLNAQFSEHSSHCCDTLSTTSNNGGDVMERRDFLKLAAGFAAGAATLAASAQAAPLAPQLPSQSGLPSTNEDIHPAVTSSDEVNRITPEEVRWGHHWHHRHWGHRHWGWRHRHWGWRHRHWHHRHWRRW